MKDKKNLEKLELSFHECSEITYLGVSTLINSLQGFKSLRELHLDFKFCGLTNKVLLAFPALFNIKKLRLDFSGNKKITHEGIKVLSDAIGKLTNLKDLSLGLSECVVRDSGFESLSSSLSKLNNLEKLNLKFNRALLLTGQALKLLSNALENLINLSELSLDFSSLSIKDEDEEWQFLMVALSKLNNLKKLDLRFSFLEKNFVKQRLELLSKVICNLTALRDFSLDFSSIRVSDEEFEVLSGALSKLNSLEKLNLNFWGVALGLQSVH